MIRVLDLFSGIGGFSLGLKRAGGFRTVCYVENEPYCQEVLLHRMQEGRLDAAPVFGDITGFPGGDWSGAVDLIVGGFPCQDLSVAGKREGIDGARSGLWREFARIIGEVRPRVVLVENVSGLLTRGMGRVLGNLAVLGYGVCWRVLDAQFFGVPQRRRRVFVVGHLGGVCPPEILLEPEGGEGDSPKGEKAGEGVALSPRSKPSRSGGKGDRGTDCTMIAGALNSGGNDGGFRTEPGAHIVSHALGCPTSTGRNDPNGETFITGPIQHSGKAAGSATQQDSESGLLIAAPLTSGSHPNSNAPGRRKEDDENLVAFDETQVTSDKNYSNPKPGAPCHPLAAGARPPSIARAVVAIHADATRGCGGEAKTPSPDAEGNVRLRDPGMGISEDGKQFTLNASHPHAVATGMMVRRLTPIECERLQGFPDNWTFGADSNRYKALGNAVAVPVIEWIGRRLARFGQ